MKSELKLNRNPKSRFSESIKTVRTNLAFSTMNENLKVLLVTSPEMGDGKSFIAANLAVAYAQEGKKVLVIDADLRRGRQHQIFDIANSSIGGYSNLILKFKQSTRLSRYIYPTATRNVFLLPTGPTPPNPTELLGSDNNRALLEGLKEVYDIIIVDCPPALGLSDAIIMTKYSDANVVVISNNKTKIESLDRVKKTFEQSNAKITGVIFNKAKVNTGGYYGYYGYYANNGYYGEVDGE